MQPQPSNLAHNTLPSSLAPHPISPSSHPHPTPLASSWWSCYYATEPTPANRTAKVKLQKTSNAAKWSRICWSLRPLASTVWLLSRPAFLAVRQVSTKTNTSTVKVNKHSCLPPSRRTHPTPHSQLIIVPST